MEPTSTPFEDAVAGIRESLLTTESSILALKQSYIDDMPKDAAILPEVPSNIMLAYRHVEDARMRLGKVFQALNGGVSNNLR